MYENESITNVGAQTVVDRLASIARTALEPIRDVPIANSGQKSAT
ncbi:MAG TPA: hypothetical protein VGR78_08665 [Verrucomicrobiae bacterium]|jgi:hypothetical protein|nr:hypothetical protein [Verrucomicrobiae bacterium]